MAAILAGVQGVDPDNMVKTGFAVRSAEFEQVWLVAARIYGPGNGEDGTEPGVWAISGAPDAPGIILAVNGLAKEFSDYPDAGKSDAAITLSSDGVADSIACVR